MDNQTVTPSPTKPQNTPVIFLSVFCLLLLAATTIFAYQTMQLKARLASLESTLTKPAPTPTIDETADWQTFTASVDYEGKQKYEFKYPKNYEVKFTIPQGGMGEPYTTMQNKGIVLGQQNQIEDGIQVSMYGIFSEKEITDSPIIDITINGIKSKKYQRSEKGFTFVRYFLLLPDQKNYFLISIVAKGPNSDSLLKTYDQILSTFKFTSKDLKTYINKDKGYQIEYPQSLFVRFICPDEELTLIKRQGNDNRNDVNMSTCARDVRYDLEVVTYDKPPKTPKENPNYENYNITQSSITVANTNATKYVVSRTPEVIGPGETWFTEIFIPHNGKTFTIYLGKSEFLDSFIQILSTFRFL